MFAIKQAKHETLMERVDTIVLLYDPRQDIKSCEDRIVKTLSKSYGDSRTVIVLTRK